MRFLLLIIVGIVSGIFAGMGMGGGTFLVPLLSIFFGVKQVICQSTNVLCFLILAVFCLVIYARKKLVDFKIVFVVSLPAVIVAGLCCFFSLKIKVDILKIIFSCFIILIGVMMLLFSIFAKKKD